MPHHFKFRVLFLGDDCVGKTCLVRQFIEKQFDQVYEPTLGADLSKKTITVLDKRVRLHIWDTSGQKQYRSITDSYIKTSAGILLVYDMTNVESFESIRKWLKVVKKKCPPSTAIMLVGNKSDKTRIVSKKDAIQFAKKNDIYYMECSAKTAQNVEKLFRTISRKILKNTNRCVASNRTTYGVKNGDLSFDENTGLLFEDTSRVKCCVCL